MREDQGKGLSCQEGVSDAVGEELSTSSKTLKTSEMKSMTAWQLVRLTVLYLSFNITAMLIFWYQGQGQG